MKKLIKNKLIKIYLRNKYGMSSTAEFIKIIVNLQIGMACILFIFCMLNFTNMLMLFMTPILSAPFLIIGFWFNGWLDVICSEIIEEGQKYE